MSAPTDHLANERTFLAWLRTGLSMLGLGFVVAKFGLWLRQLAMLGGRPAPAHTGASLWMGLCLIGGGAMVVGLSAVRYQRTRRDLERGAFAPARQLVTAIAIGTLAVTGLLAAYLIFNGRQG